MTELQSNMVEAFRSWQPTAPDVVVRTKCNVTLDWKQEGPFQFIADQLLYRIERNNKMPPWVVVYSGGKTTKVIDNLAPRHPYRFRLKVILKATAVTTLVDRATKHYGDEKTVKENMTTILDPTDNNKNNTYKCDTTNENGMADMEIKTANRVPLIVIDSTNCDEIYDPSKRNEIGGEIEGNRVMKGPETKWLESRWSEETWTSTDTDGTSAVCFCMAVRCGYIKQVQLMLEEKPSLIGIINSTNGFTPLATAVRKGEINTVKFLIAAGAELDQPSATGQTPLHLAVLAAHRPIVELLLERGADFKARDLNGLQVEHYAVDSCSLDMLRLILDRGGDVAARDNSGWTPLFRALCQGAKTDVVEELVLRGSDLNMTNNCGLPLTSVARLLKNRHGRSRDSILRLVDSQYPHEKALANFTKLTKKIHNVQSILK